MASDVASDKGESGKPEAAEKRFKRSECHVFSPYAICSATIGIAAAVRFADTTGLVVKFLKAVAVPYVMPVRRTLLFCAVLAKLEESIVMAPTGMPLSEAVELCQQATQYCLPPLIVNDTAVDFVPVEPQSNSALSAIGVPVGHPSLLDS